MAKTMPVKACNLELSDGRTEESSRETVISRRYSWWIDCTPAQIPAKQRNITNIQKFVDNPCVTKPIPMPKFVKTIAVSKKHYEIEKKTKFTLVPNRCARKERKNAPNP